MATIEFINRKNKTYKALSRVINYILRPDKTNDNLIFGVNCDKDTAYKDFVQVKQLYEKETGRQYIHFVQSFSPKENITPELANEIAKRMISHSIFEGFQILLATHTDTPHIHTHFVINTVNAETGVKWHKSKEDLQTLKDYSDELCREYGLTVIDNDTKTKGHKKSGEYRSEEKGTSWKYELYLAVTESMKTAISREDFIKKMNTLGYDVLWDDNHKYITFTTPEGKKCRNRKLYPPERFTKENMEKTFERNRSYIDQKQREAKWDLFLNALNLLKSNPQNNHDTNKYPITALEGEALKEYILLHENKGEINWENDDNDFEI